jgi:hypothetical protein
MRAGVLRRAPGRRPWPRNADLSREERAERARELDAWLGTNEDEDDGADDLPWDTEETDEKEVA